MKEEITAAIGDTKKRGQTEPNSDSKEAVKEKIKTLNNNIKLCKKYKRETINHVKRLQQQYKEGIFSYAEYEFVLNRYLKGHSLEY